ncbi:MAG: tRNA 2-thiouridine(34) synthase MnmA, partial [Oscillospiraceae bacterium]|nr:tRNA 2-thiouridine(34) synthase MnmA [Oscillospiraceae bacterium]
KLYERAQALSCDAIATGHYARVCRDGEKYSLKKALDPSKDQSYVLYSLTQEQLRRTLFPLGEMTKQQTRELAESHGFLNAKKPDSQDICFVPDGDYAAFIERTTGLVFPEGDFVSPEGKVLGRHKGIIRYTVGQRRGLGVSAKEPLYVAAIDPERNTVTLTGESGFRIDTVYAERVNLISGEPLTAPIRAKVKLRYRQPERPATVSMEDGRLRICFDEPQRAPAPGQAAVLYGEDGETVLGGGTIISSERREGK